MWLYADISRSDLDQSSSADRPLYSSVHNFTIITSVQDASSRCCFAHKVLVCCERGDYNFSFIGSNNACSDINSDYNSVDNKRIKIIK